jgi:hypothetical protein
MKAASAAPKPEAFIMAIPLVPAALGIAAAFFGYKAYKKHQAAAAPADPTAPAATLTKGATYTIQASLDRTKADAAIMVKDNATAATYLYNWFTVCGFKVLGTPVQRVPGNDSAWVIQGQWTKDTPTVSAGPNPAVPSAAFYLVPIGITPV